MSEACACACACMSDVCIHACRLVCMHGRLMCMHGELVGMDGELVCACGSLVCISSVHVGSLQASMRTCILEACAHVCMYRGTCACMHIGRLPQR